MGVEDMAGKAKDLAGQHSDQVREGADKAGDAAKERVGHDEQVDKAVEKGKEHIPGGE